MAYRRILVPVDGSPTSLTALAAALRLARESGGRVRLVHFFDALDYLTGFECRAQAVQDAQDCAALVLEEAAAAAAAAGVAAETRLIEPGVAGLGPAIADDARAWGADLVVVGTHGRRGFERAVMGSGAEQIVRLSPVPVMTIRAAAEAVHA